MAEPIDTGNKTISGRTIWNDPETGEDYSERSTTFEIEGKYYTMPTVSEDGRQHTDDQIRDYVKKYGPIDYLTGEKLPEFRYREDAVQYAVSRSGTRKPKMAEGGLAMNNEAQMAALFEEGGIADDGMRVDPVSGNEIPPGSMASEVRDDVPAQLSEGEYVVPADVLRFYGVKFFEDLRSQAKQGLGQMEDDGRIGGEPVPPQGPQQGPEGALTPEEMAVLQEMGMNVGGMVPQQRVGYNLAGLEDGSNATVDDTQAVFDIGNFGRGFMIDRALGTTAAPAPAVTMVTLYGPANEIVTLTLPAQQEKYDELVALGYTTEQTGLTMETPVEGGYDDDPPETPKPVDYSKMSGDELRKAFNDNIKARNLLTGMGIINPVFAIFGRTATNLAEKQILAAMEVKEIKPPKGPEGFFTSIGNSLKDIFGIEGNYDTPADEGTFKSKGMGSTSAQKTAIQKSIDDYQAQAEQNEVKVTTSVDDDDDNFLKDMMATTTTDVGGNTVTERTYGDTTVGADEDGLNKGGFISKRSKKKKNK